MHEEGHRRGWPVGPWSEVTRLVALVCEFVSLGILLWLMWSFWAAMRADQQEDAVWLLGPSFMVLGALVASWAVAHLPDRWPEPPSGDA